MIMKTTNEMSSSTAFSVSGPSVWNNLPAEIRLIDSHPLFRRRLKSHLFELAFN